MFPERDPNRPPPPKSSGKLEFEYFGDRPPELLGFEDICPERPPCPECANMGPLRYKSYNFILAFPHPRIILNNHEG